MATPKKNKSFLYNLATVLKFREIREKQEQDKFVEAKKKLLEEQRKEKEIKDYQNNKYDELTDMMGGGKIMTDMSAILNRKAHLEVVKEQVIEQVERTKDAEVKKEDQREVMVTASKEKKVIEKDKDRKRGLWRKARSKEETKFLDDIASSAFTRKLTKKDKT